MDYIIDKDFKNYPPKIEPDWFPDLTHRKAAIEPVEEAEKASWEKLRAVKAVSRWLSMVDEKRKTRREQIKVALGRVDNRIKLQFHHTGITDLHLEQKTAGRQEGTAGKPRRSRYHTDKKRYMAMTAEEPSAVQQNWHKNRKSFDNFVVNFRPLLDLFESPQGSEGQAPAPLSAPPFDWEERRQLNAAVLNSLLEDPALDAVVDADIKEQLEAGVRQLNANAVAQPSQENLRAFDESYAAARALADNLPPPAGHKHHPLSAALGTMRADIDQAWRNEAERALLECVGDTKPTPNAGNGDCGPLSVAASRGEGWTADAVRNLVSGWLGKQAHIDELLVDNIKAAFRAARVSEQEANQAAFAGVQAVVEPLLAKEDLDPRERRALAKSYGLYVANKQVWVDTPFFLALHRALGDETMIVLYAGEPGSYQVTTRFPNDRDPWTCKAWIHLKFWNQVHFEAILPKDGDKDKEVKPPSAPPKDAAKTQRADADGARTPPDEQDKTGEPDSQAQTAAKKTKKKSRRTKKATTRTKKKTTRSTPAQKDQAEEAPAPTTSKKKKKKKQKSEASSAATDAKDEPAPQKPKAPKNPVEICYGVKRKQQITWQDGWFYLFARGQHEWLLRWRPEELEQIKAELSFVGRELLAGDVEGLLAKGAEVNPKVETFLVERQRMAEAERQKALDKLAASQRAAGHEQRRARAQAIEDPALRKDVTGILDDAPTAPLAPDEFAAYEQRFKEKRQKLVADHNIDTSGTSPLALELLGEHRDAQHAAMEERLQAPLLLAVRGLPSTECGGGGDCGPLSLADQMLFDPARRTVDMGARRETADRLRKTVAKWLRDHAVAVAADTDFLGKIEVALGDAAAHRGSGRDEVLSADGAGKPSAQADSPEKPSAQADSPEKPSDKNGAGKPSDKADSPEKPSDKSSDSSAEKPSDKSSDQPDGTHTAARSSSDPAPASGAGVPADPNVATVLRYAALIEQPRAWIDLPFLIAAQRAHGGGNCLLVVYAGDASGYRVNARIPDTLEPWAAQRVWHLHFLRYGHYRSLRSSYKYTRPAAPAAGSAPARPTPVESTDEATSTDSSPRDVDESSSVDGAAPVQNEGSSRSTSDDTDASAESSASPGLPSDADGTSADEGPIETLRKGLVTRLSDAYLPSREQDARPLKDFATIARFFIAQDEGTEAAAPVPAWASALSNQLALLYQHRLARLADFADKKREHARYVQQGRPSSSEPFEARGWFLIRKSLRDNAFQNLAGDSDTTARAALKRLDGLERVVRVLASPSLQKSLDEVKDSERGVLSYYDDLLWLFARGLEAWVDTQDEATLTCLTRINAQSLHVLKRARQHLVAASRALEPVMVQSARKDIRDTHKYLWHAAVRLRSAGCLYVLVQDPAWAREVLHIAQVLEEHCKLIFDQSAGLHMKAGRKLVGFFRGSPGKTRGSLVTSELALVADLAYGMWSMLWKLAAERDIRLLYDKTLKEHTAGAGKPTDGKKKKKKRSFASFAVVNQRFKVAKPEVPPPDPSLVFGSATKGGSAPSSAQDESAKAGAKTDASKANAKDAETEKVPVTPKAGEEKKDPETAKAPDTPKDEKAGSDAKASRGDSAAQSGSSAASAAPKPPAAGLGSPLFRSTYFPDGYLGSGQSPYMLVLELVGEREQGAHEDRPKKIVRLAWTYFHVFPIKLYGDIAQTYLDVLDFADRVAVAQAIEPVLQSVRRILGHVHGRQKRSFQVVKRLLKQFDFIDRLRLEAPEDQLLVVPGIRIVVEMIEFVLSGVRLFDDTEVEASTQHESER